MVLREILFGKLPMGSLFRDPRDDLWYYKYDEKTCYSARYAKIVVERDPWLLERIPSNYPIYVPIENS